MTLETGQFQATFYSELLASQVINLILLGLMLYLSACVLRYGYKTGSWKRHTGSINTSQLSKGGIYTLCVITILTMIPRLIMTEIVFNVNNIPGAASHCEALIDISNIAHYFNTLPRILFLWYRQHTINSFPVINRIALGKWAKVVSFSLAAVFAIGSFLINYFYLSPNSFDNSPVLGCVFISIANGTDASEANSRRSRDYILAAAMLLSEIVLLILFIYPLYRVQLSKKNLRRSSTTKYKVDSSTKSRSSTGRVNSTSQDTMTVNDALSSLIKRSSITATISVIADLLIMIISGIVRTDCPVAILMLTYNVICVVNAVCIIFTFSFYKKIICILSTTAKRTRLPTSRSDAEPSNIKQGVIMSGAEQDTGNLTGSSAPPPSDT